MSDPAAPVSTSSPADPAAGDPQWRKYVDSPGLVLATCFFVTGFLGVPLIFMCRKFSPAMKVVWSVAVTLWTFALFGCTAAICWWSYLNVMQAWGY